MDGYYYGVSNKKSNMYPIFLDLLQFFNHYKPMNNEQLFYSDIGFLSARSNVLGSQCFQVFSSGHIKINYIFKFFNVMYVDDLMKSRALTKGLKPVV